MILYLHSQLRDAILHTVTRIYGVDPNSLPALVVEHPPDRKLGDLSFPLAFELARHLRKAPKAIAREIVASLEPLDYVDRVEASKTGYINFYFNRKKFLLERLKPISSTVITGPGSTPIKTIVEHTAINPNKAAHVGHLRNTTLGDTLVRLLRYQGHPVEVQNYIDNTGVQVADVVLGFQALENLDLEGVKKISETTRFDYYCWDLYARVTTWYDESKDRLKDRARTLHNIENENNIDATIAKLIANRIVRCHLKTMARINVSYDLIAWEGDILSLKFWAKAFDILKHSGVIFKQNKGKLSGCWVMQIDDASSPEKTVAKNTRSNDSGNTASTIVSSAHDEEPVDETQEKVIVRSDGTVTYVGKDIAYQFWKFGLLGKDFHYKSLDAPFNNAPLWSTSASPQTPLNDSTVPPRFGSASRTYNVIDTRQTYLQKLLQQALIAMGHVEEARRSIHFSYEMVALSHSTARELGLESADPGRPFIEVSGRKGFGVKADDLLDQMLEKAFTEVKTRNPDLTTEKCTQIARMIATAAIRYFMIKFSRGRIIVFDIDEALSFEGESGPYIQYALVRANNILKKLQQRTGENETDIAQALTNIKPSTMNPESERNEAWDLIVESARLDEIVDQSVRTLELSVLAKYAFGVAQQFNAFYHQFPIINEPETEIRLYRAATVSYFKTQMTRTVSLMGFEIPTRM